MPVPEAHGTDVGIWNLIIEQRNLITGEKPYKNSTHVLVDSIALLHCKPPQFAQSYSILQCLLTVCEQ